MAARKPPRRIPVDDVADELRRSRNPRADLLDAWDDLMMGWAFAGLPVPVIVMLDHVRTLGLAAAEAERTNGGHLTRGPILEPRNHGA